MRNIYILLAIASIGIFGLAGCGNTAGTANYAANSNTAAKTNSNTAASPKTDASAATVMKVDEVTPDKTVKVSDLIASVAASKDGWKGKEVTVSGYVSATSGSGKQQLLTIINDKDASIKVDVSCAYAGDAAAVFSKPVEVKGKISVINTDGEYKSVNLEPCDLKK